MKKNIIYLAALAMMAAACSNEDNTFVTNPEDDVTGEVRMITETITATNGDAGATTRSVVDADAKFAWSTGDEIAVHVNDGKYYNTEALAESNSGNKSAVFTIEYPDGKKRDAFAVYPASIVDAANYGQSGATLNVTLPGSYTLDKVSGTTTPCPMIADNTGSSWTFKQLCGLLRLTLNSIPPSTSYLTIDFNGNKVQGAFSLASPVIPGTSVIETSATEGSDDIITITDLGISSWIYGMVLNLPLPTGTYTNVTVTAYNSSDAAILTINSPLKAGSTYTAARATGRMVTASMPVFSVSDSKRVVFAPGNLQATTTDLGATWTWHFAEHQYDWIGNAVANTTINGKGTVSENGTIDLFGYSTDHANNFYGIIHSKRDNYYPDGPTSGAFIDWGGMSISGYSANYWYTMAKSEWEYLLNTRTTPKFAKVTLCKVDGLLIFPDNFVWNTTTMGGVPSTVDDNNGNYNSTNCSIASNEWNNLEAAGVVFLPGTGFRSAGENKVSNLSPAQGYYWFSDTNGTQSGSGTTYDNNWGCCLHFYQGGMTMANNTIVKRSGAAVRLAHVIE